MIDILLVSNYKVSEPISGGQRRTYAFKKVLSEYYRIASLSLTKGRNDPSKGFYYIDIEGRINGDQYLYNHLTDFHFSQDAVKDQASVMQIQRLLCDLRPRIIQFEQPWSFPLILQASKALKRRPKFIYSSQNIEWELKQETLNKFAINDAILMDILTKTRELETFTAKACDLNIAVSQQDANKLSTMGAQKIDVIPNCAPFIPRKSNVPKERTKRSPYLVFVGSNHPPNHSGFKYMIGDHLGFLPQKKGILTIVGGVSSLIIDDISFSEYWIGINSSRVAFHPHCSDSVLNDLIQESAGIILPITQGGGTNLKTAEALLHNKPIISTSHAFRGFEKFVTSDQVYISDSPRRFRQHMRQLLLAPQWEADRSSSHLAELTWEYQIKDKLNSWADLLDKKI